MVRRRDAKSLQLHELLRRLCNAIEPAAWPDTRSQLWLGGWNADEVIGIATRPDYRASARPLRAISRAIDQVTRE
jgi:hypothetical protein